MQWESLHGGAAVSQERERMGRTELLVVKDEERREGEEKIQ